MVAIKDRLGFVSGEFHSNLFRNPCLHHVSHCGSSKVVAKLTRNPGSLTSRAPALVKHFDLLPVVMDNPRAIRVAGLVVLPSLLRSEYGYQKLPFCLGTHLKDHLVV